MSTGTVRFHRVLRAPTERVYRAFLDADAMAKWLPPYGFTCKVHHLDAKVGGTFSRSRISTPGTDTHSVVSTLSLFPTNEFVTRINSMTRICLGKCR